MLDLGYVKKDFSSLMGNIHPWMLSHFVMWLDIKVAEFKVYGHMVLDDTPNDTPKWLRCQKTQASTDTLSNSSDLNTAWSESEGHTNTQIVTLQEGCPSAAKQARIRRFRDAGTLHVGGEIRLLDHMMTRITSHYSQSHDQTSVQQSNQIPHGHNATHRPLPNLTRQPQIYTGEASVNSNNKRQYSSPNTETNDHYSDHRQSHSEEPELHHKLQVSQIELQKRWAQEIEKCVSQTGVTSVRAQEEVPSGTSSRATIVLNELQQQQYDNSEIQNRSLESSQQCSTENYDRESTEITERNVIKIELSSDDESQSSHHFTQQRETTDTGQGEIISPEILGFDSQAYSLHESDLKEVTDDISPVPVSIYSSHNISPSKTTGKEDEASWRNKKWEYFEKLRKNQSSSYVGAKVHSQSLQNLLPFPDPFPLENLQYGPRAQEMIDSGNFTRSGKMQFLDTVFNEVVKYTGLYPSPQQKNDIAKAIITSFPNLNKKTHPFHSSPMSHQQEVEETADIELHSEFKTFSEFQKQFDDWCAKNSHSMKTKDSKKRKNDEENPFQYVVYVCKHFGAPRMKGKHFNPNQSYVASGCTVTLRVGYVEKSRIYRITTLQADHNHETSRSSSFLYPSNKNKRKNEDEIEYF